MGIGSSFFNKNGESEANGGANGAPVASNGAATGAAPEANHKTNGSAPEANHKTNGSANGAAAVASNGAATGAATGAAPVASNGSANGANGANGTAGGKRKGGYRPTKKDKAALKKLKQGKSIGFTMRSSLKAKGLLRRANGTMRVSKKYQ
jgi:hypothetical protein